LVVDVGLDREFGFAEAEAGGNEAGLVAEQNAAHIRRGLGTVIGVLAVQD